MKRQITAYEVLQHAEFIWGSDDASTHRGVMHRKRFGSASLVVRAMLFVIAGMVMLTMFAAPSAAQFYHYPMHVGVRCQNDFQYSWASTIDAYSMCDRFIGTIQGTDWIDFYFNLHGANVAFNYGDPAETCDGCGGADSVDFFFMNTHGGNWAWNEAVYGMWDNWTVAWSSQMRLGEVGQQAKIFATYACDTFQTSDGHFWDRWAPAYSGGLKVGLGAHDLVYDGDPQKGWEFAGRMQNGEPIGQSWLEAVWYANNDNHPSVANTGVDSNDCWYRMGMDLESVQWMAPLRDGQIGYVCWAGWNGY